MLCPLSVAVKWPAALSEVRAGDQNFAVFNAAHGNASSGFELLLRVSPFIWTVAGWKVPHPHLAVAFDRIRSECKSRKEEVGAVSLLNTSGYITDIVVTIFMASFRELLPGDNPFKNFFAMQSLALTIHAQDKTARAKHEKILTEKLRDHGGVVCAVHDRNHYVALIIVASFDTSSPSCIDGITYAHSGGRRRSPTRDASSFISVFLKEHDASKSLRRVQLDFPDQGNGNVAGLACGVHAGLQLVGMALSDEFKGKFVYFYHYRHPFCCM